MEVFMPPVHNSIRRVVLLSLRRILCLKQQAMMLDTERSHQDGTLKLVFFAQTFPNFLSLVVLLYWLKQPETVYYAKARRCFD